MRSRWNLVAGETLFVPRGLVFMRLAHHFMTTAATLVFAASHFGTSYGLLALSRPSRLLVRSRAAYA